MHHPSALKHSDVASFSDTSTLNGIIGCGVYGANENGDILLAYQLWWPKKFATTKTKVLGKMFGNKTVTCEMFGILLPFLLIPSFQVGQYVVISGQHCRKSVSVSSSPSDISVLFHELI
jgi:hypothetical protein